MRAFRIIQDMYANARSRVRVNGQYSSGFEVGVGVHQGSVLSPLLFILVLEALDIFESSDKFPCAVCCKVLESTRYYVLGAQEILVSYFSDRKEFFRIDEKTFENEHLIFVVTHGYGLILSISTRQTYTFEHIKGSKTNQDANLENCQCFFMDYIHSFIRDENVIQRESCV